MTNYKRNYEALYKTYEKNYKKERTLLSKRRSEGKLTPTLKPKMSIETFRFKYQAVENLQNEKILQGKIKSLNVMQELIHRERNYKRSLAQAKKMKEALKKAYDMRKEIGLQSNWIKESYSINELMIRGGPKNVLKRMVDYAKKNNLDVGVTFYGS